MDQDNFKSEKQQEMKFMRCACALNAKVNGWCERMS